MNKNIIKAGALMLNDNGEMLIVRKKESDIYITPGGKIEEGETDEHALRRELSEELKVKLKDYESIGTYTNDKAAHDHGFGVTVKLYNVSWEGNIIPSAEIYKVGWLTKEKYENKFYSLSELLEKIVKDLITKKYLFNSSETPA